MHGNVHPGSDLLRGRLSSVFLNQAAGGADQLVDRLDHVHGNTNGPGLVGDGAGDGLTNPPGGVGRKLVASTVFELVHRFHQADIALLDQIQELESAIGIFLGDGDHQAQIRLHQFPLGAAGQPLALLDGLERPLELNAPRLSFTLQGGGLFPDQAQFPLERDRRLASAVGDPPLQVGCLQLQGAQAVPPAPNQFDQPDILGGGQPQFPQSLGDPNPVSHELEAPLSKGASLPGLRRLLQSLQNLIVLSTPALHPPDAAQRLPKPFLQDLRGEHVIIQDNGVVDGPFSPLELQSKVDHLLDGDG